MIIAVKNDFIMPILVLSLICLVMTGAMALTHIATEPVIDDAAARRAEEVRRRIIPQADGFEELDVDGLPDSIKEAYRSTNGAGYIFIVLTNGYGGDLKIICGVDPDGNVIHCTTLEQHETKGLGSRITEEPFEQQFDGVDAGLAKISAITGATISSRAYIHAVEDALVAFILMRER